MTKNAGIRPETWRELNARKEPGDSFSDILAYELGDDVERRDRDFITIELTDEMHERIDERRDGRSFDETIRDILR